MPPSSAGASSYEDEANSYKHDTYSAALNHSVAASRVGDGDARHRYRHEDYQDEAGEVNESN